MSVVLVDSLGHFSTVGCCGDSWPTATCWEERPRIEIIIKDVTAGTPPDTCRFLLLFYFFSVVFIKVEQGFFIIKNELECGVPWNLPGNWLPCQSLLHCIDTISSWHISRWKRKFAGAFIVEVWVDKTDAGIGSIEIWCYVVLLYNTSTALWCGVVSWY